MYSTCSFFKPASYLLPNSSSETFPIKPTLSPSCDIPTIELATEPPETVFSILRFVIKFLNSSSNTESFSKVISLLFLKVILSNLYLAYSVKWYEDNYKGDCN